MKSVEFPFRLLAIVAALVLGAAAVWMGGLNQDEGWYLYAANLVAEGQLPYADFAYTQGPLMPIVYSGFTWIWGNCGLLGARIFTLFLGFVGVFFACAAARRLAGRERGNFAALVVLFLLGVNLYHLYYLAIPKAYALASLFVTVGFFLLTFAGDGRKWMSVACSAGSGVALAFAAGTRISLGALLAVAGIWLLVGFRRYRYSFLWFGLGGALTLAIVYGPFLAFDATREGLVAAQRYHAARGGFDPVWVVGSVSRLVRWYLPLFIVLGLGIARMIGKGQILQSQTLNLKPQTSNFKPPTSNLQPSTFLYGFLAVFAVQMLAPFPYEDYQVPVMALLAVFAAVEWTGKVGEEGQGWKGLLLVLGLAFATAFGSPLLEQWSTNGKDRFWSLKKEKSELSQLRDVARRVRDLDPGGKTIFTQDTYLAVETGRKVPKGLEMGPFSVLTDEQWRRLLSETAPSECPLAALSGYTFAIEPPKCAERPVADQMAYWELLRKNYRMVAREEAFGQGATPLLILKRK